MYLYTPDIAMDKTFIVVGVYIESKFLVLFMTNNI